MAIGWASTGNAGAADQDPGGEGLTTASRTLAAAVTAEDPQVMQVGSDAMHDSDAAIPGVYIGLAIALIILKFVAEESGEAGSYANIRIGFFNILVITFSAIIGLVFVKYAFSRIAIPGLSDIVKAA